LNEAQSIVVSEFMAKIEELSPKPKEIEPSESSESE